MVVQGAGRQVRAALLHSAGASYAIAGNDRNTKVYFVCGTESSVTPPTPTLSSSTLENFSLDFRPTITILALPLVVSLYVELRPLTPCRF